jgi:hypothetical protein
MDLTVCAGTHERLVITDHALVVVQVSTPEESQANVARVLFGGLLGAAVGGDGGSLLGGGSQSILNLGNGKPVPPLHHMLAVTTCFASEVPPELASSRGWPKVADFRRVTFYPRALIGSVTLSWAGALRATLPVGGSDYETRVDLFSVWKARDALRRWGYPLS